MLTNTISSINVRQQRRTPRRRRGVPLGIWLCMLCLVAVGVAAAFGNLLVSTPPLAQDLTAIAEPASGTHWFGTDHLGRDVFSRTVVGARPALIGPTIIALSGVVISAVVGIVAGYVGGSLDSAIMRVVDFIFALPGLLVTIVIVSVAGGGYWMAIALLAVLNVPGNIRIVRSVVLAQRSLPYVEAARTVGVPRWRIMLKHILPNISPILVANFAIDFAGSLVALAGLAFLGLGSQPGTAEWGRMVTEGQATLFTNPLASVGPGVAIVLLAVSVNLLGDWLYEQYAATGARGR